MQYDPTTLLGCGTRLGDFGSATWKAQKYCDHYVPMTSAQDGLITDFASTTQQVASILSDKLSKVAGRLDGGHDSIMATYNGYQIADQSHRDEFDQLYGQRYGDLYSKNLPTGLDHPEPESASQDDPAAVLVPPSNADVIPDLFYNMLDILGALGDGGSYLITTIGFLVPVAELIERLNKTFSGDWNIAEASANALAILHQFTSHLGDDLNAEREHVGLTWEGEAAEGADEWMKQMVKSIDGFPIALQSVSSEFQSVSAGMQSLAVFVDSLLSVLVLILIAIIAAVVAAFFTEGASLLAAAGEAALAVLQINSIFDAIALIELQVSGLVGITATYLAPLESIDNIQTPTPYGVDLVGPYDN